RTLRPPRAPLYPYTTLFRSVVAGDQHDIGMRFGDTGCNSPDALFSNEFDVDAGVRVRALEIVDELREVLNGVNIMVRWWGNQPQDRKSTRLNSSHVSISYAV